MVVYFTLLLKTPQRKLIQFSLGLIDISQKLVLAVLAGVSQFFQTHYMPKPSAQDGSKAGSFQESFAKSMQDTNEICIPFVVTLSLIVYLELLHYIDC